jgi:hypothetical protein
MGNRTLIIRSWIALAVALLLWGGTGVFAWQLMEMETQRAAYISDVAAATLEQGQAAQLRALARDTLLEREVIVRAGEVDVLAAVNMIESVKSGNVPVKVTGAQTEKVAPEGNRNTASSVMLLAHAEGPFSSLMHILQMLETLPLLTTVQAVEISRPSVDSTGKNNDSIWVLNVRLRFLTTADLSV